MRTIPISEIQQGTRFKDRDQTLWMMTDGERRGKRLAVVLSMSADLDWLTPGNLVCFDGEEYVDSQDDLAICTNCNQFYKPERVPSASRDNYCPNQDCRKRAARRNAVRRFRTRQKDSSG